MEKETEENTNTNEGESLLKEIELNFKQIKKNAPNEISSQIQTYYAQFITLTKGSEKDQIMEKLQILNTIVNNTSEAFKSLEKIPKKIQKYLLEVKRALYQLNTLRNISSYTTKIYKNGILYDKLTAKPYDLNASVKETNIRNGKEIAAIYKNHQEYKIEGELSCIHADKEKCLSVLGEDYTFMEDCAEKLFPKELVFPEEKITGQKVVKYNKSKKITKKIQKRDNGLKRP